MKTIGSEPLSLISKMRLPMQFSVQSLQRYNVLPMRALHCLVRWIFAIIVLVDEMLAGASEVLAMLSFVCWRAYFR